MFVGAGLAMAVIALAGTRMSSIRSLRGIDETARPAAS
jgi:hypothetical protein